MRYFWSEKFLDYFPKSMAQQAPKTHELNRYRRMTLQRIMTAAPDHSEKLGTKRNEMEILTPLVFDRDIKLMIIWSRLSKKIFYNSIS